MKKDHYHLEEHRLIYNFILNNPGSHLRKISRELNIHLSTLIYRLDVWEKKGIIVSKKEKNLKNYFVADKLSKDDKNIASLLQQKRFRDIILLIIINPEITHSKIVEELALKPSTLTKYIKIIEHRNVIDHKKIGREKQYYITEEDKVMNLLLTYKKSFWDSFVDTVLRIYFER